MMKWFLAGFFLAIADPILLYQIYSWYGGWAAIAAYAGPILLSGPLMQWSRRNITQAMQNNEVPSMLTDALLLPVASGFVWYPGPVTSVIGLLLLMPPVRRLLARYFISRVKKGLANGNIAMVSNLEGMVVTNMNGMPSMQPVNPGGLKRAEGTVVEDAKQLPPAQSEPKSDADERS
jgi:UPF0716 family protein affecting phage T7 exclusion